MEGAEKNDTTVVNAQERERGISKSILLKIMAFSMMAAAVLISCKKPNNSGKGAITPKLHLSCMKSEGHNSQGVLRELSHLKFSLDLKNIICTSHAEDVFDSHGGKPIQIKCREKEGRRTNSVKMPNGVEVVIEEHGVKCEVGK